MTEKPQEILSALEWLGGHWQGIDGDALLEEIWMVPEGKTMLGMSRVADIGRTFSVEFLLLEQQGSGVVLTLTLPRTGRIEKMELKQIIADKAMFENIDPDKEERLIYQHESDDSLTVILEKFQDDQPVSHTFRLRRIP